MGRLRTGVALALATAALAACATTPPAPVHPRARPYPRPTSRPPIRPAPRPVPPPAPLPRISFASLPGWESEDHADALRAYQAGCGAARDEAGQRACRRARAAGSLDEARARAFFEDNFRIEPLAGEGLLTAYFQPEYEARVAPEGEFTAPVRPRPVPVDPAVAGTATPAAPLPYSPDPIGQDLKGLFGEPAVVVDPTADRAAIEAAPLTEPALAWMRPEDLFFMQIQGSGVLSLPDGRRLRAAFAASNGKPFVGLARLMRQDGLLADADTSQEAIHAWLVDHRGPQADALMRRNPRYVFFKVSPDDGEQPAGSAGVPLPPGRSLAVDLSRHAAGELYWIDASAPALAGAFPTYRRLAVALDTGGAIKGEVRADLYMGRGAAAGREAGRVRHSLRMYRLVPRP
jgi:membrane-bound lytic murein transglycosylase A